MGALIRRWQGDLVDGHLARVVHVKHQLSATVGSDLRFHPGTDLDRLQAAFLLRAGVFTPVFLQQHDPIANAPTVPTADSASTMTTIHSFGTSRSAEIGRVLGLEEVLDP